MSKELCYIGDPCYVLPDFGDTVVKDLYKGNNPECRGNNPDYSKASFDGESFFMSGTWYGDGEYTLMDGDRNTIHKLGVDSGTLAAIPLRILPLGRREGYTKDKRSAFGAILEIDLVNCSEEDGKFTFDQYTVETQPITIEDVPDAISVYYTSVNNISVQWLEEKLNIKWADIKEWWIKHDEFHAKIAHGDCGIVAVELDSGCDSHTDFKWPDLIRVYDKDFNLVEERD